MKETMKMAILYVLVGAIVFAGALVFFNHKIASEKGNPVVELSNATYPVMEIAQETGDYNRMSAYRGDIDLSLVRNQVTVVDHSKTLELKLHNYDYDITAIQYVLFEKEESHPLEKGTLNQLKENKEEHVRTGTMTFTSDLKQGKNYYLKMTVRLDNSTRVSFYTKVQNGAGYNLDEYFTYVKDFHQSLFDKSKMEKIAAYLEPISGTADTSMEYVNINSSTDAVFFGNMEVKEVAQPSIKVREINETYAVVELDTVLSSEISSGVVQYYDVKETYKLRYTKERMYLLDYERNMDAYYNEAVIDPANNYVGLGIQNEENVQFLSSDGGRRLCFVVGGQLWYYDYEASDVSRVYSFTSENLADIHNDQDEHGIRILRMDDKGNMIYLVYGYVSRGRHEGENGIQIMRYDAASGCNEELAFLVSSVPYSTMKEDVAKLAYLNQQEIFYCLLGGDLHQVDLKEKEDKILVSGIVNESLTASKDQSIIAVEKQQELWKNTEIAMIDLESNETRTFSCKEDERIRSVGFLDDDFIYGLAEEADVRRATSGAVTFPIKEIYIRDIDGNPVKNYQKKDRYIMETSISGSVLEMDFGRKGARGFTRTEEKDYIRYKEEEREDAITLASKNSDVYGDQLYFKFPDYVYIQVKPDLVLAKILASEDNVSLTLQRSGENIEQYYVYADGETQASFTNLPEAVNAATQARGNVIDSEEHVLWECVFAEYAMVAGMDQVEKVRGDGESLAGCLSMIARVNGKNISPETVDTQAGNIQELLEKYSGQTVRNLTGCSLDDVLYYVSKGSPVLARHRGGRYVIVMSYNSTKIRYLDPVTGKSTVEDRTAVTEAFKKAGNNFYSYLTE